ncbi:MAG TPA: HesA/MoeB/ThiF family protein [Methylomirabilota bacterium]|jgi:molybdopterin/thiamine biosynthesis adenylyltransferase|nr:HesA/MoeB/ThiF family protein [Methylomirabilota bacterium]
METVLQAVSPRIRNGRVLIVGVGGLGSPAALALAQIGVGTLGLIDPDAVDLSNLQRQILHHTPDVGRPKVLSAQEKLSRINPAIKIVTHQDRLHVDNLPTLFQAYDFIIDATDGVATKFLINDGAVLTGKSFSYGGIVQFSGQTLTVLPRKTACLRCLFPNIPSADDVPTCQESGIIGSLAGSLGFVQAMEAVKYLSGEGILLTDRLLTYDASISRWRTVAVRRNPRCPLCSEAPVITSLAHARYTSVEHCTFSRS